MAKSLHSFFHPPMNYDLGLSGMPITLYATGDRDAYSSYDAGDPWIFPSGNLWQEYRMKDYMVMSERGISEHENEAKLLNLYNIPSDDWSGFQTDYYPLKFEDHYTKWKYEKGTKIKGYAYMSYTHTPMTYYSPDPGSKISYPISQDVMSIDLSPRSGLNKSDYWALIMYNNALAFCSNTQNENRYHWTGSNYYSAGYDECISSLVGIGGVDQDIDQSGYISDTLRVYCVKGLTSEHPKWTDIYDEVDYNTTMYKDMLDVTALPNKYKGTAQGIMRYTGFISHRDGSAWADVVPYHKFDSYYSAYNSSQVSYTSSIPDLNVSCAGVLACGLIVDGVMQDVPTKFRMPRRLSCSILELQRRLSKILE